MTICSTVLPRPADPPPQTSRSQGPTREVAGGSEKDLYSLSCGCFGDVDNAIPKGYYLRMIKEFEDKETEKVFNGRFSRELPPGIQRVAERKLILLHRSETLNDLRVLPANRLEALKGARTGQHSIRIDSQWRVCFEWREYGVYDVEIVDYH